jgi:hypothetical protein
MVTPNWNIFLWILLFLWTADELASIALGALSEERPTRYGLVDIIIGIVKIIVVLLVLVL